MIVQMHKITGLQLYCHVLIVAQKMAASKTAKFISNIYVQSSGECGLGEPLARPSSRGAHSANASLVFALFS